MPRQRPFGVSTHLFQDQRLTREHLQDVRAAGFEVVELIAARTHFDYHSDTGIADLRGWLAEAGLVLHAVHAPVAEGAVGGRAGTPLNLASGDAAQRQHALDEARQALHIARQLPFERLVVHMGVPRAQQQAPGESRRDAARRSVEALAEAAAPLGVSLALEVLPNELSGVGSLVHFVEDVLEDGTTGICLDLGHAHLAGDVVDAVETASEHLLAVHAHDNRGRSDEHLMPFQGTIDWPSVLTALQKVGYEGPITLEPSRRGTLRESLAGARSARERMERMLAHL